MELGSDVNSGRDKNPSEHDTGAASDRRARPHRSADGSESIGASQSNWQGTDSTPSCADQSGCETHGKALRLQIESVRNQKAIVRLLVQQLDEQEKQLEKVLNEYEEVLKGEGNL